MTSLVRSPRRPRQTADPRRADRRARCARRDRSVRIGGGGV